MRAITISVMAKRVTVDQVQVIPALPSTFPQKSWYLWSHGTRFHKCRDGGPHQFCLPVSRQVTCLIHCKNEPCSTDPHSKHCVCQYQSVYLHSYTLAASGHMSTLQLFLSHLSTHLRTISLMLLSKMLLSIGTESPVCELSRLRQSFLSPQRYVPHSQYKADSGSHLCSFVLLSVFK